MNCQAKKTKNPLIEKQIYIRRFKGREEKSSNERKSMSTGLFLEPKLAIWKQIFEWGYIDSN